MADSESSCDRAAFYGSLENGFQFYRRPGARFNEKKDSAADVRTNRGNTPLEHQAFHKFDKSHQVMLAEEEIVPQEMAAANLEAFRLMEDEGEIQVRRKGGHRCHAGEAYLIDTLGEETAGWLHVGRSTGDLFALSRRYRARESLLDLMDASLDLMEAYCEAAEEFHEMVMPNYTLHQQAQVATFGWYLIGWERPIERTYERLSEIYPRVNRSPAGLAAGTTTDFPINRERTAELMGFDGVVDNAEDGLHADFDFSIEILSSVSALATSIAFAADHILLWNTSEFGMIDLPDRFFGTSSIMPHKRNPDAIRKVQKDASRPIGELMGAFADCRNISGHPGISHQLYNSIVAQASAWTEILQNLQFNQEHAEEKVYQDWALTADLAGALVRERDIPWRWAHQITSILVRQAIEEGRTIREIAPEHIDRASETYLGEKLGLSQGTIDEVIDAQHALDIRSEISGSPAPNQVRNQIKRSKDRLESGRQELSNRRDRIGTADKKLEQAIDDIING